MCLAHMYSIQLCVYALVYIAFLNATNSHSFPRPPSLSLSLLATLASSQYCADSTEK